MLKRQRPIITCADCAQSGKHQGRGLCSNCHERHRRQGTLHLFGLTRPSSDNPRRYRECPHCCRAHRSPHSVCRDCRRTYPSDLADIPLTGGRWVNVGGIQRWLEDAA